MRTVKWLLILIVPVMLIIGYVVYETQKPSLADAIPNRASPDKELKRRTADLMEVAEQGQVDVAKTLLEHGANPNMKDNRGSTPLMHAFVLGSPAIPHMVKLLLDKGADANAYDNSGASVLSVAVHGGDLEVVRLLLERGADVNAHHPNNPSALFIAASEGHAEILKLLLEKGTDLRFDGEASLIAAAGDGHLDAVKLLLDKGVNISAKGQNGETALMAAARGANIGIVKLFLDKGLNLQETTPSGYTVLMAAARGGNPDIAKLMLDTGLDVNARTRGNETALMEAAHENDYLEFSRASEPMEPGRKINHIETVRILLAAGADPSTKDWQHRTALDYAENLVPESRNDEIVKLLNPNKEARVK